MSVIYIKNSMTVRKFILPALSKIELHHQFSDEGKSCLRNREQGLRPPHGYTNPESSIEKKRFRRMCTSHFRGWQVYVETLIDCAVYR